ncbi:LAETG motif-containing sortase-dependent surface protein [Streptomyces sp. JHA26]|uniref:LAETG motif-containing sortase-dependent surface protein n=1 Tax=Streptomyces sp. JHA26 TaxID=1917143 RepID=UPI00209B09F0|nr:LAETG motif-containing sortase-dependent surface protein [Streptomyces sp. JHA26]
MATAAATAVIAPLALLATPAAHATTESPSPSASAGTSTGEATPDGTQSTTATASPSVSASDGPTGTGPSATGTETAKPGTSPSGTSTSTATPTPTSPAPSTSAPEGTQTPEPEPSECEDAKVDVGFTGLPGEIAAGSGWHKFTLNVVNNSDSTLQDLAYLAGVSPDEDGYDLFKSKQVGLQAWNPDTKGWDDLDEYGYTFGWAGSTSELKPGYEVDVPLRINVRAGAPAGSGFTLGATLYGDADGRCAGIGEAAYKFRIVAAGTDTEGTEPQEGGKAPVTGEKPAATTPEVTGSLAETGSSSALPVIGLVGGLAVLVGGGAVFAVRRRKAGADA